MTDAGQSDARRWLLSGDLPCLGCDYNMRGLVGPLVRCPECGRVNDLRQPDAWRDRELPLGVRERDHWPATAVMWSLGCVFFGLMTAGMAMAGSWPFIPGVLLLAVLTGWGWVCRAWLRSVRESSWGLFVIVATHACAWAILGGVILTAVTGEVWWVVISPLGAAGLGLMRGVIRRADGAGQFRQDWRRWQVPVGDLAAAENAESIHLGTSKE